MDLARFVREGEGVDTAGLGSYPTHLIATIKRPAAKKRPAAEINHENSEEELNTSTARDKGKGMKWASMRKQNRLDDWIIDHYDKEAPQISSSRTPRYPLTICSISQ